MNKAELDAVLPKLSPPSGVAPGSRDRITSAADIVSTMLNERVTLAELGLVGLALVVMAASNLIQDDAQYRAFVECLGPASRPFTKPYGSVH